MLYERYFVQKVLKKNKSFQLFSLFRLAFINIMRPAIKM